MYYGTSTLRRERATVELLREETPNFLVPNLWPPNNRDLSPLDYKIFAVIVSTTDKSTVWMNWNGGSPMSGAVFNSRVLTRLLTSDEKDIERVSMLKSTACELTMLILSIPVTLNVTCLSVISLITKSCQQRWPIHSCSFYKAVHQQIWVYGGRFYGTLGHS